MSILDTQGDVENHSGKEVRLGRSSLIIYAFSVLGAVFSFVFIILVARRLSTYDYGIWTLILRYISYFLIPTGIFTAWVSRNISRGQNTSRTGLIASVIMAAIGIPFYLVLVLFASKYWGQPIIPLAIAAVILLFEYLNSALNSISSGYAPHLTGISNFIYDATQATSGYILVISLALGLTGVVIAAIIGKLFTTLFYFSKNYKLLKTSKFELEVLKGWVKASWIPMFGALCSMVFILDALIINLFSGATPVAYFGVCANILTTTLFASAVANSVYPKIVSKGTLEDLKDAYWYLLLLSLPVTIFILIYATPISAIFGMKYLQVAWPLRFFALGYLITLLVNLLGLAYQGLENCDMEGLKAKRLFKSAFFKGAVITLIFNLSYIIALAFLATLNLDAVTLTSVWGLAYTLTYLAVFIGLISLIRRDFHQGVQLKYLAKKLLTFAIPSVPMVIIFYVMPVKIAGLFYDSVINLLPQAIISFGLYFLIIYAIDAKFRKLIGGILNTILAAFMRRPK